MKKIFQFLLSMRFTAILLILFAAAVAIATYIENEFGTSSARAVIYNTHWFEILILSLVISFTGSVIQNKLYGKEKRSLLAFHFGFVMIIIGAAFTRFTGFKGIMHIREGNASDIMLSENTYISLYAISGEDKISRSKKVLFSPLSRNSFKDEFTVNAQKITLRMKEYIPYAEELIYKDTLKGIPLLQITVPENNQNISYIFRDKEIKEIHGVSFSFNDPIPNGVNIFSREGRLFVKSSFNFSEFLIAEQSEIFQSKDSVYSFTPDKIYIFDKVRCSLVNYYETGIIKITPAQNTLRIKEKEALVMEVKFRDQVKDITILNKKDQPKVHEIISFDGMELGLKYGSIPVQIPFSLKLIDFNINYYRGTDSPSSFESKIVLVDNARSINDTASIYLNNSLKYKGYRFVQSSYDPDERGTILSVNRDFPGTFLTYLGYILLVAAMASSLISSSGHFRKLIRKLKEIHLSRQLRMIPIILIFSIPFYSHQSFGQDSLNINPKAIIPPEKAEPFGKLWVRDRAGRIKPLNTVSSEILRKMHHKSNFHGLTSDQVFLSMLVFPEYWKTIPMIKVSNDRLRDTLKIASNYAAYEDLMTFKGYVLKPFLDNAIRKNHSERDKFDNEVLKVDERFKISDQTFNGIIAQIFPSRIVKVDRLFNELPKETQFVSILLSQYVGGLLEGIETGDYSNSDKTLNTLWNYQIQEGQQIVPSFGRTNLEIFYNKAQIFQRLSLLYGLIGSFLLIMSFISIFVPKLSSGKLILVFKWIIFTGFIIHSSGLIIRWYVSGHAPWSDGYEIMVFISWVSVFAGILFSKRSSITLAVTALLSFLLLLVAHQSWIDPEIRNLYPVLRSFWLIIHVSVITASYAFFGIAAFLGIINLGMMTGRNNSNAVNIEPVIAELTCIIEISLIIGLYLLSAGTILGGLWANESWGRYWGWDPKESWALITIIVYALISNLRLIPGLKSIYLLNLLSVIGFGTVVMTYFGTNYYFSGLHAYARGPQPPIPIIIYFILVIITVLALLAYLKQRKNISTTLTD